MSAVRRAWGQVTDLVLDALRTLGSGTYQDIADWAETGHEPTRKALHRMSREPATTRRVHVARWVSVCDGERAYPRPVYVLGPGSNVGRPGPVSLTVLRRESNQRAHRLFSTVHPGITQKAAIALRAEVRRKRSST